MKSTIPVVMDGRTVGYKIGDDIYTTPEHKRALKIRLNHKGLPHDVKTLDYSQRKDRMMAIAILGNDMADLVKQEEREYTLVDCNPRRSIWKQSLDWKRTKAKLIQVSRELASVKDAQELEDWNGRLPSMEIAELRR